MSSGASDATGSGDAAVSGFGAHLLVASAVAAGRSATAVTALTGLGIEDAEQLVAVSAVPGLEGDLRQALGVDDEAWRALLDSARAAVPAERAELLSRPTTVADLGLGVREPTPEIVAAAEASAAGAARSAVPAAAPPSAVNLIPFLPPIRNQASRGTCVSFTLTALNEYVLRRRGQDEDLSEQHLYDEIKRVDGAPDGCGTWQSKAVLALRDRGQCREAVWPYDPNPPCNNHGTRPAQARPDGLRHRLVTHAVATRVVAAYKAELARQRPVTLSIPVYDSWYRSAETRRSGRITMRLGNEASVGGHAVCLVGHQDTASGPGGGYFLVRNSWSTSWAAQSPYGPGYGTIPYQYVANEAWEAYSAAVPGVGGAGEEADADERAAGGTGTSVVIDVGPHVRIRIESN
ncbi:C1 family peptidase [Geodermatophilus sp. URMC 63]